MEFHAFCFSTQTHTNPPPIRAISAINPIIPAIQALLSPAISGCGVEVSVGVRVTTAGVRVRVGGSEDLLVRVMVGVLVGGKVLVGERVMVGVCVIVRVGLSVNVSVGVLEGPGSGKSTSLLYSIS